MSLRIEFEPRDRSAPAEQSARHEPFVSN